MGGVGGSQRLGACRLRVETGQEPCQGGEQSHHLASWQTEEEARAPTLLALGCYMADAEELAHLAVLLNDALAVGKAEAMTLLAFGTRDANIAEGLVVKDVAQLLGRHAAARVGHGELHVVGLLQGADGHVAAAVSELAGIVSQGVQHEERQHAVGLDGGVGRYHGERHPLHVEAGLATEDEVEQGLQGETLDMQAELALPQLYPLREQVVLLVNLVREFSDVFHGVTAVLTVKMVDGVKDAVDEGGNAVDQRHLGALLQVAAL